MDPRSLFYSFRSPCTHTRNWLHLLCRPFLQYGRQLLSDLDVSVLDDHRPHLRSWSTRCCNRHTQQGYLDIDPQSCWGSSFPEKYLLHYYLQVAVATPPISFINSCTFEFPARGGPVY